MLSITITCVQFLINYQKFFFLYLHLRHVCLFKRWKEISRNGSAWSVCGIVSYRDVVFKPASPWTKILNATYRYNFKCIFHCYYFNVITCKDSSSLWWREQFLTFFFIRFIRITRVYFEQVMKKIWRQFRDKLYDDSFKIMMILAKFIYLLHEFSD